MSSEILKNIKETQNKLDSHQNKKKELIEPYNQEKRKEQDVYFTIRCIPGKSNHCTHTTGLFSTHQRAQDCLPECGYSYDSEDNCSWSYSIECIKSTKVSNFYDELDKYPNRFPLKYNVL
jgi:hypothetical protein